MDLKRPQVFAYAYFPVADVGSRVEKYDSLFDALMHVRLPDPLECPPIARLQMIGQDVEAFRVSKGVFYSVNAILARTETAESNRIAYNAIPLESFETSIWFEYDLRDMLPADSWKPPVSSDRTIRRGCLIEREGSAFRAYHFFESPDGSFKEPTSWRIFRDSTGKVCWSHVGLVPPQFTAQDDGERVVAYLLYMTALRQVRATPGKLSGKSRKKLNVLRLEPPWDRCDLTTGLLPVQSAAARPSLSDRHPSRHNRTLGRFRAQRSC